MFETTADHDLQEPLFRLKNAYDWLSEAIERADALAIAEHWSSERVAKDRVRDLFLERGGSIPLWLDGTTDWRRVVRGVPDEIHRVVMNEDGALPDHQHFGTDTPQRMPARPWPVDWMTAGRMQLADMIGRHVQWAQLYLAVGERGRLQPEWRAKSLEEVMFLQLMEHVQRTPRKRLVALPYWNLPRCSYCGGVIMRNPRKPTGQRANHWHSGRCRNAGQVAQVRAEER